MVEYRTPEEDRAREKQEARIREVLNQAIRDGISLVVAMELDEPQEVVEQWTNRLWNGLRDGLIDGRPAPEDCPLQRPEDDRLAAIVSLLQPRIIRESNEMLRGMAGA